MIPRYRKYKKIFDRSFDKTYSNNFLFLNYMKRVYILECENVESRPLFDLHKEMIGLLVEKPKVLVLLWTTNNREKIRKYMKIIDKYFRDLGAKEITFLDENDEDYRRRFRNANILYLPGGSTRIFLEKLRRKRIAEEIKHFRGIIIGNSAGAIVLSKIGYVYRGKEMIEYNGLSILNIRIIVHFKPEDIKILKIEGNVIGIRDDSAVIFIEFGK